MAIMEIMDGMKNTFRILVEPQPVESPFDYFLWGLSVLSTIAILSFCGYHIIKSLLALKRSK